MANDEVENSSSNPQITSNIAPVVNNTSQLNASFGHPISTVLTVKLDDKNYFSWRGMVLAVGFYALN